VAQLRASQVSHVSCVCVCMCVCVCVCVSAMSCGGGKCNVSVWL